MPKTERTDDESGYEVTSHSPPEDDGLESAKKLKKKQVVKKGGDPQAEPRVKQTHVARACVNCQRGHVACGLDRPCQRCIKMGKTATCVDVEQKKRGWRKGRSRINQRRRTKNGDQAQEGQNSGSDEAQEEEDQEEHGAGYHNHDENGHHHHIAHGHSGHSHQNGHPATARQGLRWSGSAELDQDTSATASSSISPVREPPARLDPLPHPHSHPHPHPHSHPQQHPQQPLPGRYQVYPAQFQPHPQPHPHQQHLQMPPTNTSPSITPVVHPFDPLALPRHPSTPMPELFMTRPGTPSLPPHSLSPYPSAITGPPFLQFQDLGSGAVGGVPGGSLQPFIYPQPYPLHRPPFSTIIPPGPPPHNLYPQHHYQQQQQHGKLPVLSDSKFFIMVLSLAASVLDCHDITCSVLGFAKVEVIRKSFFDLIHPADIEITQKVFLAAVKLPPETEFILLFRIRSKLGEFLWIEAKGVLEIGAGSAQSIIKLVGGLYHEKPFTDPPSEDH